MHGRETRRVLLAAAGLLASAGASVLAVDRQTHGFVSDVSQWPSILILREIVTPFGQTQTQLLILLALWLAGILAKNRRCGQAAALALISMLIAGAGAQALKFAVPRARPFVPPEWQGVFTCGYYHSFPSADTATAVAGALAVGHLFPESRWWLLLAAALVGLMRVLRLAHWPSDVLGGAAIGLLGYAAARWIAARRGQKQTGRTL